MNEYSAIARSRNIAGLVHRVSHYLLAINFLLRVEDDSLSRQVEGRIKKLEDSQLIRPTLGRLKAVVYYDYYGLG